MMASQAKGSTAGKLTGRKVLMIFCGAFTIIIGVNILLMVKAIDTFSGLVVPNSYVASQEFNTKRAAQVALGWNAAIDYHDGAVYLTLLDDAGKVVRPRELSIIVGRATTTQTDHQLELVETPKGYASPIDLAPGNWRIDIEATAENGAGFLQYRSLVVPPQS